jgi:hypothetical protein
MVRRYTRASPGRSVVRQLVSHVQQVVQRAGLGAGGVAVAPFVGYPTYRIIHWPFGQVLKSVRENEPRALSLGDNVDRYKLVAFVLSGAHGLLGRHVARDVGHRLLGRTLRPQRAGAAFALTALRGHTQFELDVVKTHARAGAMGNGLVADAAADADNHGAVIREVARMIMNRIRFRNAAQRTIHCSVGSAAACNRRKKTGRSRLLQGAGGPGQAER